MKLNKITIGAFLVFSNIIFSRITYGGGIPEKELEILEKTFTEVGLRRSDSAFVNSKSEVSANLIHCKMAQGRSVYRCTSKDSEYEFYCQVASEHEISGGKQSELSAEGHYIQCESKMWFCEKELNHPRKCWSRNDFEREKLKTAPVTTGGKPVEKKALACSAASVEIKSLLERFLTAKAANQRYEYIDSHRDKSSFAAYLLDLCDHAQ